jgi:hypothetical protein
MISPRAVGKSTLPVSVAVCITGQQRTLLASPVVASFSEHVVDAHRSIGHALDTFIVVVGRWRQRAEAAQRARSAAEAAYRPTRLVLSEEVELNPAPVPLVARTASSVENLLPLHCRPQTNSKYANRLMQFVGIREAYHQMEERERERGRRYDWVYRTRPDMVYLAPAPFAQAGLLERAGAAESAYVLAGTDDGRPSHTCLNDMVFVCPRALCRPHFSLIELWEST